MTKLSHLTPAGELAMVDVSAKPETSRSARAEAFVRMSVPARRALTKAALPKGDAFVAAQLAGIMAAKQTPSLIPLAHPLPLSHVDVRFEWTGGALRIESEARTVAATGVEMEAMVAACVAALTVYDMCKSLDKGIVVENVRLVEKRGGKSGTWRRGARRKSARV
ncbi:MAG: cyclic pyranopterin monophosphate synthase MoaC [Candidatus Tumulicola sp.]